MDTIETKGRMNDAYEHAAQIAEAIIKSGDPETIPQTIRALKRDLKLRREPPLIAEPPRRPPPAEKKTTAKSGPEPTLPKKKSRGERETEHWNGLMNGRTF